MPAKLLLKLLSGSGELLNVVSCYGGQISVFRANSQSDLRPYQRALAGAPGPERLSIQVDGKEYVPEEHTLIGFSESLANSHQTVRAALLSAGVGNEAISGLLLSYGLDADSDRNLNSLSPDLLRRVQILLATFAPTKALIINEPFEPISLQWRETFAELLIYFARDKKGLIIVPSLSYRPDCWIDNDVVARIQVGESLQRTIGFSHQQGSSQDLVKEIRELYSTKDAVIPEAQDYVTAKVNTRSSAYRSGSNDSRLFSVLILLAIISAVLLTFKVLKPVKYQNPDNDSLVVVNTPVISTQIPQNSAEPTEAATNVHLILDDYPQPIKLSLLATFNNEIAATAPSAPDVSNAETSKDSQQNKGNLFKLLESAGGDEESKDSGPEYRVLPYGADTQVNDQQPPPPEVYQNDTDEEAKREAIRQKFLDAIRAAADRRSQETGDPETTEGD